MKTVNKPTNQEKEGFKESESAKHGVIKTDFPLSEKDEVKKAEDMLQKRVEKKS